MINAWTPETIRWQETGLDGSRLSELGRFRMGVEVTAAAHFMPSGTWNPPYFVDKPMWIFVADGVLCVGKGEIVASRGLHEYPTGSLVEIAPSAPHFDGCHESTLIFTLAPEGTRLTYVKKPRRSGRQGGLS